MASVGADPLITLQWDVLGRFLTQWLTITDVVKLDSAYCNHSSRPHFLKRLNSDGAAFEQVECRSSKQRMVDWIGIRGVRIKELDLPKSHTQLKNILTCTGHYLETIKCSNQLGIPRNECADISSYCPNLGTLKVNLKTALSPGMTSILTGCPKLHTLQIPYNYYATWDQFHGDNVTNRQNVFSHISCPSMRTLVLDDPATNSFLKMMIKAFPGLTRLEIAHGSIRKLSKSDGIAKLCPALESLSVVDGWCSNKFIMPFIRHCSNLSSICIGSKIMDAVLVAIGNHCKKLERLQVHHSPISDTALITVVESCLGLTFVDVSDCNRITDTAVTAITETCPQLQEITLSYNERITDTSLFAIASNCASLKRLNISCLHRITDAGVVAIAQKCLMLESLDMRESSALIGDWRGNGGTGEAYVALAKYSKCLKKLRASMSLSEWALFKYIRPDVVV